MIRRHAGLPTQTSRIQALQISRAACDANRKTKVEELLDANRKPMAKALSKASLYDLQPSPLTAYLDVCVSDI